VKWVLIACFAGLYYLACLGVDLLPWNKEKEKDLEG
jgi:hypothetical protein